LKLLAPIGDTSHPFDAEVPDGATVVGEYHTHGDYSRIDPMTGRIVRTDALHDEFNSDNFSSGFGADLDGIRDMAARFPGYRGISEPRAACSRFSIRPLEL
jgi:hypothetical protein